MFNPDLSGVLQNHLSRYSLVTATAKRAREIAEEANDEGEILTEKPVSLALDEILNGEFVIVEPEEIRNL
ncbi:MAG: DNA-directed RNA polymerase subunit omega [Clostridia bacterium]|nr:DNA-directed RNA polymerase subunit omega [Clostridia bacterium]